MYSLEDSIVNVLFPPYDSKTNLSGFENNSTLFAFCFLVAFTLVLILIIAIDIFIFQSFLLNLRIVVKNKN